MKIDLTQPILNLEGKPFKNGKIEMTFGQFFRDLMGTPKEKETGEERIKKFDLGIKCIADKVDLSHDEMTLIKNTMDDIPVNPIVYGRIHYLFESK